jgi:secondary thiamine-phosphate synthase enzyme
MIMITLQIRTPAERALIEITDEVAKAIESQGMVSGLAVVFVPHTTAGVTINENADPNVVRDMLEDFRRLLPRGQAYYKHFEGNSASHLLSSIVGASETLIVEDGKMVLGTWQGIYLCEFDGPRTRRVLLKLLPDPA